jgi:protein tyrosine kinase modulator
VDDFFATKENQETQEFWPIVVRRRGSILAAFFVTGFMGFAVAFLWPPLYKSTAFVLIQREHVSEQYVVPNVSAQVETRLQAMTEEILSKERLTRIIKEFSLYREQLAHMNTEDVVNQMRKKIVLEPELAPSPLNALKGEVIGFHVSFSAKDPLEAQEVTGALASLFIEINAEHRTRESAGTTEFFDSELEQARHALDEKARALENFKMHYLGELPEQEQENLHTLSGLETQLGEAAAALDRAEQQKVYLESLRSSYLEMPDPTVSGEAVPTALLPTNKSTSIGELKAKLMELEAKYTPRHPDVVRLKQQIAELEAQTQEKEAKDAKDAKEGGGKYSGTAVALKGPPGQPGLAETESRLKSTIVEIEADRKQYESLQKQVAALEARLNVAPIREQQLRSLTVSYQTTLQNYNSLVEKRQNSQLSTNLETQQQGDEFRLVNPASLPDRPDVPNRPVVVLCGWLLGVVTGIGLSAFRELTDNTVRSDRDAERLAKVSVLVDIPRLLTPNQKIRQRWFRLSEVIAITILVALFFWTGFYAYMKG